jgi:phosphoribosylanthranilate isomerase
MSTVADMNRTRIKICGMTSPEDALASVQAGADAIGLIFYPPSPRHLSLAQASAIAQCVPPFIARVAVMVNPSAAEVAAILREVPVELLQFHGDESAEFCASFGKPYLKAVRVRPGVDLLEYSATYPGAAGFLLDTYRADRVGGTGQAFDWALIPKRLGRPTILSGGLDASNIGTAITRVRPWAVDVSSGVESSPGVKSVEKIAAFVAGVRNADQ